MGQRGSLKGKYSELNKEENISKFALWAQKFINNIIDWFYVAHFSSWFSQPCLHKVNHSTILTVSELLSNKKEKLLILVAIWMNFKGIMLSEKSQPKRLHIMWFHLYDVLEKTELKRKKMDEGFPVVIVVNHKEVGLEGFFPVWWSLFYICNYVYVKIRRTIPKRTILL